MGGGEDDGLPGTELAAGEFMQVDFPGGSGDWAGGWRYHACPRAYG